MDIAGDLVVKSQDWPGAEDIAERIKLTIPQEIRGSDEGEEQPIPPQAMQQMQQMKAQLGETAGRLQAAQTALQERDQEQGQSVEKAQADMMKAQNEATKLEIEKYRADTERLKVEQDGQRVNADVDTQRVETEGAANVDQALSMLAQAMAQLAEGQQMFLAGLAQVGAMVAAPRKSQLIFDESGMPVEAVSTVVPPETIQ